MNSEYSYEDMIEKIGEDRLHEKYTEVLASANHFIEEAGYESHVECNERDPVQSDSGLLCRSVSFERFSWY